MIHGMPRFISPGHITADFETALRINFCIRETKLHRDSKGKTHSKNSPEEYHASTIWDEGNIWLLLLCGLSRVALLCLYETEYKKIWKSGRKMRMHLECKYIKSGTYFKKLNHINLYFLEFVPLLFWMLRMKIKSEKFDCPVHFNLLFEIGSP